MSKKEANRVANLIKANKAEYYVADVNLESNDVHSCAVSIRSILPESNFMLISSGKKELTIVVDLSSDSRINAKDWLKAVNDKIDFEKDTFAKAIIEVETPFKHKDFIRSKAFAYLRKMNLLEEESEDEEYFEF